MRTISAAIVCLTAGCLIAGNAIACGESLFRVGKGVAYRQYTAPLPGNILAVANTEAEMQMVAELTAAGHHVHVVSTPEEAARALAEEDIDVVLAYYSQADDIQARGGTSTATLIPVALSNTAEEKAAAREFRFSLSSDDSVKTFLKTIHRSLKASG